MEPGTSASVRFASAGGLSLEGEIRHPSGPARGTAVLCHPLPTHGGSKDHPILWSARIALSGIGLVVLSFNFRGVMGSEGTFDAGLGELDDTRAAIDRVREEAGGPTFVFGWSFGAHVALREAIDDDRVAALAMCGIPLHDPIGGLAALPPLPSPGALSAFDRPVLLCVGGGDEFSPRDRVEALAGSLPRAEVQEFPGAGHFFPRRDRELAAAVGAFAGRSLFGEAG